MKKKVILSAAAALLLGAGQVYASGAMKKSEAATERKHADCPWETPGVKTEKKPVKNGVEFTLTAESPEKAAELKEKIAAHRASGCPLLKGGDEVTVENLENVVKVTMTAKKAAKEKPLQGEPEKGCACCSGHGADAAAKTPSKAAWICTMGDYEGSDKPGRCPNCGMNLVENKTK